MCMIGMIGMINGTELKSDIRNVRNGHDGNKIG